MESEVVVGYVGYKCAYESSDQHVGKVVVAHVHAVYRYERGQSVREIAIHAAWVPEPDHRGERKRNRCLSGGKREAAGGGW